MSNYKNKKTFLKAIKKCVPFSACTDCYLGIIDTSKNKWLTAPKNYTDNKERLSMYDNDIIDYLRVFPSIIGDISKPNIKLYTNYREV